MSQQLLRARRPSIRQGLDAALQQEAEDSIWLRVFVQALVTVGIVATATAADRWSIVWAVPLSAIGAAWSWSHRRKSNVSVKFCIAIGMLVVLGMFLSRLVSQMEDSRLMLAELLIQLQVLHSFDLPRRKDLGYSAIIGFILLGVAAILSQTSIFGLFLLLFLAIALPVLVLDYRSRLGLTSYQFKSIGLAPKRLGLVLLVIVGLGLAIFSLMPRLPGYQIRTFPVSAQIDVKGEFNDRQVINPGYVRGPANSGSGLSAGQGDQRFSQQFDSHFYYGLNNQINQNLRGKLIPKVVMRVRSQAEGFWRVLAFDRYTGQGWEVSRNDQVEKLNRSRWSYQFRLPVFPIGQSKEIVQTYTVVSELPNLLPALAQPEELYFPTQQIALGSEGELRSPVALPEGLTYTVVSEVPYRDRTLLQQAATEYPAQIRNHYLKVPTAIAAIRQKTQALLATSSRPLTSPYEQALYLAQALKQNYTIQPDLPQLAAGEDLVEAFLFRFQGGYPDHFSTALTVMLRSIGIPARLVVGFGSGQFNPLTGLYIVRNTDAYAMTEVYFPRYGWFTFDPIPGHELVPPSIEANQTFSVLRQFWQWIAGWLPSPVTGLLVGLVTGLLTWLGHLINLFTQGWIGLFAGLLLTLSLSFLGWLGWNQWRTWRHRRWLAQLPPMESLYQQMLNWLAEQGVRKRPEQTPLEYAEQIRQAQASSWAPVVEAISHAYVGWRYGGHNPNLNRLREQFLRLKKSRTKKPSGAR